MQEEGGNGNSWCFERRKAHRGGLSVVPVCVSQHYRSIANAGSIGCYSDTLYCSGIAGSSRAKRFHRHYTGNRHYSIGTIPKIGTIQLVLYRSRHYSKGTTPEIGTPFNRYEENLIVLSTETLALR